MPIIILLIAGGLAYLVSQKGRSAALSAARTVKQAVQSIQGATRYVPGSPDAIALFQQAAALAGVPLSWANDSGLMNILAKESNGYVGIPNYRFGEAVSLNVAMWPVIWDELRRGIVRDRDAQGIGYTATGLGQLNLANVKKYYPSGVNGIGVALEEAVGMLKYIKDRYQTPANAWALYGKGHEGY